MGSDGMDDGFIKHHRWNEQAFTTMMRPLIDDGSVGADGTRRKKEGQNMPMAFACYDCRHESCCYSGQLWLGIYLGCPNFVLCSEGFVLLLQVAPAHSSSYL